MSSQTPSDTTDTTPTVVDDESDGDVEAATTEGEGETISADVEYAPTPVEQIMQQHDADEVYMDAWADYHDVFAWLLPFDSRSTSPMTIGFNIAETLGSLKETAETFTRSECDVAQNPRSAVEPFLFARGVTIFDDTGRRKQYRNPDYIHYDTRTIPIEDTDERLAFYNRYADIGTVDIAWIAKHFDMDTEECREFIIEHTDTPPEQRLQEGQLRIGKTTITAEAWGVYGRSDIATALGLAESTLETYIERVVASSWNPPHRPDDESWFGPTKPGRCRR